MKKDLAVAFSLLAFIALNGCSRGPNVEQMKAAASEIDQQLAKAINNKDLDSFIALYWQSPDLVILDNDAFTIGLAKWKTEIMEWFEERPSLKMKFSGSKNAVSGDLVLGYREWDAWEQGKGGLPKVVSGLYHDVKAFRDGKWVIVSQTFVRTDEKGSVFLDTKL